MIWREIERTIIKFLSSYSEKYTEPTIFYLQDIINILANYISRILESYQNISLLYSVKANYNNNILNILSKYVYGFDIASYREFEKVKKYKSKAIFASGYAFSEKEMKYMLEKKIKFDFVSIKQMEIALQNYSFEREDFGVRISLPQTDLENNRIKKSRFGIDLKMESDLLKKIIQEKKITIRRIHLHNGEKNLNTIKLFGDEIEKWISIFKNIEYVNLGGGWDYLVDRGELAEALSYISKRFPEVHFYIEPGNMLVRKCGILVTKAIDFHPINEHTGIMVLDCSAFNLSSWYSPSLIAVLSKGQSVKQENLILAGNTCYEDDIFVNACNQKRKIGVGDLLFFYPTGGYYYTTHRNLHGLSFPREKCM